jgi:3-dehydroquinate dehydratase/shikimate dehydrogenase
MTARFHPRGLPPVCIALAASTPEALIERAQEALEHTPLLEFRLDALPHPAAAVPPLARFLAAHPQAIAIATCRRTAGGGAFPGTTDEQLALLAQAAQAGCRLVDVEIETAQAVSPDALQALRAQGPALILSSHDFERTADLQAHWERLRAFAPDLVKVVSTAHALADNLPVLRLLNQHAADIPTIALAMGAAGLLSRVLSPRAGAAFTFAAPARGSETAPGQVDAPTLLRRYRAADLRPSTQIYGVAGNPIGHSLSPAMQNAAFQAAHLDAVFLPLAAGDARDLITLVRELPLAGVAVTIPFKRDVPPLLDHIDALASQVGACNTIARSPDGKLIGYNTDVAGVVRPLERRLALPGARILVLGAGGAARAAAFGLTRQGAHVFLWNRTHARAEQLASDAGASAITRAQIPTIPFDAIVNATPAGMSGHSRESVLLPNELGSALVFDMVYNPRETPLLRAARQHGLSVIEGLEMLVEQGVAQFELWTGQPAPAQAMMRAVLGQLAGQLAAAP